MPRRDHDDEVFERDFDDEKFIRQYDIFDERSDTFASDELEARSLLGALLSVFDLSCTGHGAYQLNTTSGPIARSVKRSLKRLAKPPSKAESEQPCQYSCPSLCVVQIH